MSKLIMIIAGIVFINICHASPSWSGGVMTQLSASASGIYFRMSSPLPDNCASSPYGWYYVDQADKALSAVVLSLWFTGNRTVISYTNGYSGGYCHLTSIEQY